MKTTRDDDVRALAAMALVAAAPRGGLLVSPALGTDPNGARISAAPRLTLLDSAGLQIPLLLS